MRGEVESLFAKHENKQSLLYEKMPNPQIDNAQSLVGQRIGHYEIQALLGVGGMGEVFFATDEQLGRKVALKLLPQYLTVDDSVVHRFRQEARAASSLNHPNILTIHEIGEADGRHFIAMEFVEGETLRGPGKRAASLLTCGPLHSFAESSS